MDPAVALRALALASERFRRAVAARFGLTTSDTAALGHLGAAGELTPGQLAERLELTPGTVTVLLDRLVRSGLIMRQPHPHDRRKIVVTLTEEGERLSATVGTWVRGAFAGLDEAQLAQLAEAYADGAARLEGQAAAIAGGG